MQSGRGPVDVLANSDFRGPRDAAAALCVGVAARGRGEGESLDVATTPRGGAVVEGGSRPRRAAAPRGYFRGRVDGRRIGRFGNIQSHSVPAQVFAWVRDPIVEVATKGVNATVFAYGQTGTGKTHTMLGAPAAPEAGRLPIDAGVVPRASAAVFAALAEGAADGSIVRATAHCSYLQIYGDRARDLLVPDPRQAVALQVREAPASLGTKGRVFVRGLSEYEVTSAADARGPRVFL